MGHLGLSSELTYDTLTKDNKIMIGKRLELILGLVANGELVSLMDCTLNGRDVIELASIRIARGSSIDLNDSKRKHNTGTISEAKITEVKVEDGFLCPEIEHKSRQKKDLSYKVDSNPCSKSKSSSDFESSPEEENSDSEAVGEQIAHGLKCIDCDRVFNTKRGLSRHKREKHSNMRAMHNCPECGSVFKNKRSIIRHQKEKHSNTMEIHTCPECGKTFGRKYTLQLHQESLHLKRKWPCQFCDRVFTNRWNMDHHAKAHSNMRYECDQCDKKFISNSALKCHMMNVHIRSRPYNCRYGCNMAYNDVSNRNSHEKKKHGGIFQTDPKPNPSGIAGVK